MKAMLLILPLALAACSINVQDDNHKASGCSISCPDRGHVEVSCPVEQTPRCTCDPQPSATCSIPLLKK